MTSTSTYIPTKEMAAAAAKGLKLRALFQRGGTKIGVARAHQLEKQEHLSKTTVHRMLSYFQRHEVDKKAADFANEDNPSAGYIAWLLWGGDAGYEWSKNKTAAVTED